MTTRAPATGRCPVPQTELEQRLYRRYGKDWPAVRAIIDERDAHLDAINAEVLSGEIHYIARHEMAVQLADVVWRRLPIGECGLEFESSVAKIADILCQELGWDQAQRELELRQVLESRR